MVRREDRDRQIMQHLMMTILAAVGSLNAVHAAWRRAGRPHSPNGGKTQAGL
jgi:hypothetical protein